ncbi:MAG: hypothetical protein ABSG43_10550 [Solirubrobacteraceae bacterium]
MGGGPGSGPVGEGGNPDAPAGGSGIDGDDVAGGKVQAVLAGAADDGDDCGWGDAVAAAGDVSLRAGAARAEATGGDAADAPAVGGTAGVVVAVTDHGEVCGRWPPGRASAAWGCVAGGRVGRPASGNVLGGTAARDIGADGRCATTTTAGALSTRGRRTVGPAGIAAASATAAAAAVHAPASARRVRRRPPRERDTGCGCATSADMTGGAAAAASGSSGSPPAAAVSLRSRRGCG